MRAAPTEVSPFRRLLFETSLGWKRPWKRDLEQLRTWQSLGEEGTRKLQEQLLQQLLEHAARHVPYYRGLFRAHGLLRGDRVRIGALAEIPCLDRSTLRREFDRLRSDDLARRSWFVNGTGGSTGEPVRFIQDRESGLWRTAVEHLFDEWLGVAFGTRRVRLWGSEHDLLVGRETLKRRLYGWRRNEISLNSFRMTPAQMRTYARRINQWRPGHIVGYSDSLYEFSRFAERSGLTLHSPDSVMSSSGTLLPHLRETIGRVFRAPVFNRYAAREFGGIASEDSTHDGMVVPPDKCVEILRPDGSPAGPLQEGEVVITSLTNFAMPLIRYRIGDLACLAERRCARTGWPVLAQVTGRVTDTFVRLDGGVASSLYFIHLVGVVLKAGWIRRFQVVQDEPARIVVHLVLEPPCTESSPEFLLHTRELAEKIRLAMGEDCAVEFRVREEIPAEPSGKFRYAISRVAH
jgi:phenylacetate-CoA ligase